MKTLTELSLIMMSKRLVEKFEAQAIDELNEEVIGYENNQPQETMEIEETLDGQFYQPGQKAGVKKQAPKQKDRSGKKIKEEIDPTIELVSKLMRTADEKTRQEARDIVHKISKGKTDQLQ